MTDERVECFWCQEDFWKEETEYFDHGHCRGYICENCQALEADRMEVMKRLLKKMLGEEVAHD